MLSPSPEALQILIVDTLHKFFLELPVHENKMGRIASHLYNYVSVLFLIRMVHRILQGMNIHHIQINLHTSFFEEVIGKCPHKIALGLVVGEETRMKLYLKRSPLILTIV